MIFCFKMEAVMFKKFSDNIYIQPADGYTDRPNVAVSYTHLDVYKRQM